MNKVFLLLFLSMNFAQLLDKSDIDIKQLKSVLEIASRSEQKVFVDDFTGLN